MNTHFDGTMERTGTTVLCCIQNPRSIQCDAFHLQFIYVQQKWFSFVLSFLSSENIILLQWNQLKRKNELHKWPKRTERQQWTVYGDGATITLHWFAQTAEIELNTNETLVERARLSNKTPSKRAISHNEKRVANITLSLLSICTDIPSRKPADLISADV